MRTGKQEDNCSVVENPERRRVNAIRNILFARNSFTHPVAVVSSFIAVIILRSSQADAQSRDSIATHTLYILAGGVVPVSSSVYCEYLLYRTTESDVNTTIQGRIGAGVTLIFVPNAGIPVMASVLFGNNHYFETSIGIVFHSYDPPDENAPTGRLGDLSAVLIKRAYEVGYRYQNPSGGTIFRVTLAVLQDHRDTVFSPGVGIGYSW